MDKKYIRNFSIIAHIDHGKSTLADRLIDISLGKKRGETEDQLLDTMDLEKERGITIKAQAMRLNYKSGPTNFQLNLIDTPGHVDFNYEVSRSLAACEGALLLIDCTQGIQAQTLANVYLAIEQNVVIIPVLNKIDSPNAQVDRVMSEINSSLGFSENEILKVSAKTGEGVEDLIEHVIKKIPPPSGDIKNPMQALVFDSKYDQFKGVIAYIRLVNGELRKDDNLMLMSTNKIVEANEVGIFEPNLNEIDKLTIGEVGYVATGLKNVADCRVGETLTIKENPSTEALKGYESAKPMVFSGLYPTDGDDYSDLRDALGKLQLNDASLIFEPESSGALGFGFRCGFLGLLHMDIIQERLEREYGLDLIVTAPTVKYTVETISGKVIDVDDPSKWPEDEKIQKVLEPFVDLSILCPSKFIGPVIDIVVSKRGEYKKMEWLQGGGEGSNSENQRVLLEFNMPLAEILTDFHSQLKSSTKGYASMDYQLTDPKDEKLVKLQILVNEEKVDALSIIVHSENSLIIGRQLVSKLKELIPRQLFDIPIQAAVGSKIISRETVKALRKNVTAKCYGGDISRKRKLLQKQAEGKKRMKKLGSVEVPQEAFMAVLKNEAK
ncbi:MAG: elongation factor 4 [Chloroflexi bacterium]|nr:elongation factor 4 [Chloroflexota bacterium]|tara:strand:+ start:51 stop:1877 length:1827 start_codon:yes stop_codon:yes gene_type:complete